MNYTFTTFLLIFFVISVSTFDDLPENTIPSIMTYDDDDLSFSYYHQSCPELEAIIQRKLREWVEKDDTLAASLIKLHFFDCAIRGCDGSILLENDGSEKMANTSKSLRGFELIDDIKSEVEKKCPKIVSCADILTAVARDATVVVGGPYWMVPFGRKDGRVSIAKEAEMVPMGREKITQLIEFFQSKGLTILDLVVLLGAHTFGRTRCGSIQHRIYNFNGTSKADPSIDPKYLNYLRRKCRWASEYVDLEGTTPRTFNNAYYKNLQYKMGLLSTDQMLFFDSRTKPIVNALASQPLVFHTQFVVSMVKLGNIQGEDGGEIRENCRCVNTKN